MNAINKAVLIHSCICLYAGEQDREGNPTYTRGELENVRFEKLQGVTISDNALKTADNLTLFYDCQNSKGAVPKTLDKIEWEGATYIVKSVKLCYDGEKAHHYELALV